MKNTVLPARPYQLYFEHRPGYLYAFVLSETVNFEIARGYWAEILSMQHRRRYKRVIVEKDVRVRLPAHDVVTLAAELALSGMNGVSLAIHDHQYDRERSGFEERVAINRGLNLRIFNDRIKAEIWLATQPSRLLPDKNHFPHASSTDRRSLVPACPSPLNFSY